MLQDVAGNGSKVASPHNITNETAIVTEFIQHMISTRCKPVQVLTNTG